MDDETRKLSNFYKVKLHNTVQHITLVCSNVKGAEIQETHCLCLLQ